MSEYNPEEDLLSQIEGIIKTEGDETFTFSNMLPRGYLSVSQITQYQKCGKAYYYRYIEERRSPTNHYMVQGRGVHKAAEMLHLSMIEDIEHPISTEEMEAHYVDLHDAEIDAVEEFPEGENAGSVKDQGVQLVQLYRKGALGELKGAHGSMMEPVKPVAAERVVRATLKTETSEPIPFFGVIDLEQEFSIVDLKTKQKAAPQAEADNSLQLSLYAHVTGKPDVALHQLVKPTKRMPSRYMRTPSIRTRSEIAHALDIAGEVANDIAAGRFRRTDPNSWWCTEKWCSFWDDCRGRKR